MTDVSEPDRAPHHTNGVCELDEEERARIRPVEIDADVKEMERRKRVEVIMNSRMFREELERIIETQLKDGSGTSGLMQQISDMMGVNKQAGNVFKNSNCVLPINDIRGIEAMGYGKGEKILRCKLAAVFRLIDLYAWTSGTNGLVTARLNQDEELFLVNPHGVMFHEVTASSLIKLGMQANVVEQGTTNFSANIAAFSLHAAVHAARPDLRCIINVHTPSVVAISAVRGGLLPLSVESVVIGAVSAHTYMGGLLDAEERERLARNLGPVNKVLLLQNVGALCCGETIEEAFFNARNTVLACESQLKLLPVGIDNLVLVDDEVRKRMYDQAHRAPESSPRPDQPSVLEAKVERKWRVGGVEFEALMRMLDNAGFRTGYIYRHPLVKGDVPRPKNDVEVPPAVSSLGYLLEEEENYRQGLWRKLEGGRKGHDRSRWLNSPNTYQKVEILETGTPDPKKITKWVADGSPSHSNAAVKIDAALQFVPCGTNPKEFKQKQQQIKDYRRADKISAGPQSHILEGVTWEEARKMQDATVTQTGDQVVLMGAASKGIIQRGHQHNATVYKSPYAKNPFDCVTDEDLDEYKKVVEKKVKGDYDTDYSESEGLSSAHINKRIDLLRSPTSVTSETEEESRDEPQVLRIQTKQAPRPSQPEVVLSDGIVNGKHTEYHKFHQTYYRTNNFGGLPKGGYINPNPCHFHIVRETQLAKPCRPLLIRLNPLLSHAHSPHYLFNRFNPNQNQTISLNIGRVRAASLSMSMATLNDFILPFANALSAINAPAVADQDCQTSYNQAPPTTHVTPLLSSRKRPKVVEVESSSDFEEEILAKLKSTLITDIINSENESEIDDEQTPINEDESERIVSELNDSDWMNSRRNLFEAFDETSSGSEVSLDEGMVSDLSKHSPIVERTHDASVVQLGDRIYDFLREQCFENSELVIFPELEVEDCLDKLLVALKASYFELYGVKGLESGEKSELRIAIGLYVIGLVESHTGGGLNDSSLVSDKVFTISESLNAILERFFDELDDYEVVEEVTSFKKDETKSGAERYWFAIGSPVERRKETPVRRKVVNVDDIPLPLPKDLRFNASHDLSLSPIKEEKAFLGEGCDVLAGGDSEQVDCFLNGDYVAFERPESNVVVCNAATFYRTMTTNSSAYLKADSVVFDNRLNRSVDRQLFGRIVEENEDEGDWMGFESAKF